MTESQTTPPMAFPDPEPPPPRPTRQRVQLPQRKLFVTYTILGLSIFVYLLQMGSEFLLGLDYPAYYGVKRNPLIEAGQYWRLLTPMLLHGSLIHLGFNMYALHVMGRRLERFFGPYRFLALYLLGGFAGNILSMLLTEAPSLGSSTAIFGLLSAEGIFVYQNRSLLGDKAKRALWQIVQMAGINLVIGLSPRIDNWGHVGGLLGGAAFTALAGPILRVEGSPSPTVGESSPSLHMVDSRPPRTVTGTFLALTILFSLLAGGIIYWRIH